MKEDNFSPASIASRLEDWLIGRALPFWWEQGVDRKQGGYFERLAQDGTPVHETRRCRVQSRQVYSFSVGQRMGWAGPADEAIRIGLAYLARAYENPDGTLGMTARDDGTPLDRSVSLYDQAFALFALAEAHGRFPDEGHAARARGLRDYLTDHFGHPVVGFEESVPRTLPLKSNPHMHMFEACLAWIAAGPETGDTGWDDLADQLAELALARLIQPETGYIHEYFDGDWQPMAGIEGRIVEPGHQYEWAWLLARWSQMRNRPDALAAARRMARLAEAHGICPVRGVCYFSLLDDHSIQDPMARLWPQTERMKAGALLASLSETSEEREFWLTAATAGAVGLEQFLTTGIPGLWRDKYRPDGTFQDEPAPASSLYHIVCGIEEYVARVKAMP